MEPAIATYGLTKEYPTGGGVRHLTFRLSPGEIVGLVGPPAAGKSTLLKLLATRLPATHGSFTMLGHRIPSYRAPSASVRAVRRRLGVLLEDVPVAGDLTGWENAWLLGRLHGLPKWELRRRLEILFGWAGIGGDARRAARTYSYPLRRKLGLIQALVHDPGVLLLDEPFHGLELPDRCALQTLLLQLSQKGVAALVATADPAEAAIMCSRVILLEGGRVRADGPARELMHYVGSWSSIDVKVCGAMNPVNLATLPGLCAPPEFTGGGIRVRVADPELTLPPLMEALVRGGARVTAVEVKRPQPAGRRP